MISLVFLLTSAGWEVFPPETFLFDPNKWTVVNWIKKKWLVFSDAWCSGNGCLISIYNDRKNPMQRLVELSTQWDVSWYDISITSWTVRRFFLVGRLQGYCLIVLRTKKTALQSILGLLSPFDKWDNETKYCERNHQQTAWRCNEWLSLSCGNLVLWASRRAGAFSECADEFCLAHKSPDILLSGPVRPLGEDSEKM